MKTVIDKNTGKTLYHTLQYDIKLNDNEELVDFVPDEIQEIIEVPEEITALQFFKQLLIMGITKDAIRTKAQQMFDAGLIDEVQLALIDLFITNATKILRNDNIMQLFKSAFNLDDEQLDNLFINASKL